LSARITLTAYLGETIQFRLNRVKSLTWKADIVIDPIRLINSKAISNVNRANDFSYGIVNTVFSVSPNCEKNILNVKLATNLNNTFKIIDALGSPFKTERLTSRPIQINDLGRKVYIIDINDGEESKLINL
jgi:hypothetical protein